MRAHLRDAKIAHARAARPRHGTWVAAPLPHRPHRRLWVIVNRHYGDGALRSMPPRQAEERAA